MIPLGDAATLLDLPEGVDRAAALAALSALPGVHDVVLADRRAALWHASGRPPELEGFAWPVAAPRPRVHVVTVTLDGPDLPGDAWADAFLATELEVRFLGFLPGFAYLGLLPEALALPRRAAPRARVPAGSLAIGARYAGIYPLPSPGGWSLIGRAEPPAPGAWTPGDRVRWRRA